MLQPRRRRRTERHPTSWVVRRVALLTVLLGGFGWFATSVYNGKPWRSYATVFADVPNTGNLIKHDLVRIGGVRVGQVLGTTVREDGRARIELQIEPGTNLPADTRVRVRANGLLGARYVELVPGKASTPLPDGAVVRSASTALTYGVPDALDTFDQETRGALGELLRGAGGGLTGRGDDVNEVIAAGNGAIVPAQGLFDEISSRPGAAQRLVPSLAQLAAAFEASVDDVVELLPPARRTTDAIAAARGPLQQTLQEAPAALAQARAGLDSGAPLLAAVRRLSVSADRALPRAPGALRAATALLDEAETPLDRTQRLLKAAGPAVPAALRVTRALDPVLGPLQGTLRPAIPILDQVGRYGCDLTNFAVNVRSMTGLGGTGEGPVGPAMAFRLQATPSTPTETLGARDVTGLVRRDGYPAPCAYPSTVYDTGLNGGSR